MNGNSTIDMATGIAHLYQLKAKHDFALEDDNGDIVAFMSTTVTNTGRLDLNNSQGNMGVSLQVAQNDRGNVYLHDENNVRRVSIYGDGGFVISDTNGNDVMNLLSTGRIKAPNILDKVFDSPTALSDIGDWWTFDKFAMLFVVARVKSTASYQTMFIPTEMLSTTATRFQISDDTNWISFDVYFDANDLIRIEFAGKNNNGYIHKVYGIF